MEIIELLAATFDARGQTITGRGLALLADDLKEYPKEEVAKALKKCRQEVRGNITLHDIVERITRATKIGPNEAWAIALQAMDETETVIWTQEIAECWGVALPILEAGDKVGARMAFIEAYNRKDQSGEWIVSPGTDKEKRKQAIQQAVDDQRLLPSATKALPAPEGHLSDLTKGIQNSGISENRKREMIADIIGMLA